MCSLYAERFELLLVVLVLRLAVLYDKVDASGKGDEYNKAEHIKRFHTYFLLLVFSCFSFSFTKYSPHPNVIEIAVKPPM